MQSRDVFHSDRPAGLSHFLASAPRLCADTLQPQVDQATYTRAERDAWAMECVRISRMEVCSLIEKLKREARAHAMEARSANATLAECYQAVSGKTGEPGNWHGSQPVRDCIEGLRSAIAAITKDKP